jgi:hypothetical protein
MTKKNYFYNIFSVFLFTILIINRPFFINYFDNIVITFIFNTLPNFVLGFVFTYFFFEYFLTNNRIKYVILAPLIISVLLTIEEFYPTVSNNKIFDKYDILMSWLGCFISFFIKKFLFTTNKINLEQIKSV